MEDKDKLPEKNNNFVVNKGDIPLDYDTWNKMMDKIKSNHPDGEKVIQSMKEMENNYIYEKKKNESENTSTREKHYSGENFEPKLHFTMSTVQKLAAIQKYLNQLQYNHTGMQFFNIKKTRSITRLYETAKEMIKFSLPIKCLEAVVLSLYLTAPIKNISRFTIRFKTKFGSNTHKHVVLGIYHKSYYGALGLSRRKTLMDKPLNFKTVTDLILEYRKCYADCFHTLVKVKMSTCLSCEIHSCDCIPWNHFILNIEKLTEQEIRSTLERYSREMRKKTDNL